MNFIKATLLIMLLCGPSIESAQAGVHIGSAGHSASSSLFKGGFSSQKSNAINRNAVNPTTQKSSFGSFGAAANATPPSAVPGASSALSKDLNATAANANALKTLDARSQAAIQPGPLTGNGYAAGNAPQGGYATGSLYVQNPVAHTVIVQRNNGFFSSPFLWFMLGQSAANHDRGQVIYDRAPYPAGSDINNPEISDSSTYPVAATPVQKESFGASLLRVFLWLVLLTVIGGGIICALAWRAARIAKINTHYTLGKI